MIHKLFDGRKVRIPAPNRAGFINPAQGKIGQVTYAGWDDWYYIHVDGLYFCRSQAHEIEPCLIKENLSD
jgi:hypothetical protein